MGLLVFMYVVGREIISIMVLGFCLVLLDLPMGCMEIDIAGIKDGDWDFLNYIRSFFCSIVYLEHLYNTIIKLLYWNHCFVPFSDN